MSCAPGAKPVCGCGSMLFAFNRCQQCRVRRPHWSKGAGQWITGAEPSAAYRGRVCGASSSQNLVFDSTPASMDEFHEAWIRALGASTGLPPSVVGPTSFSGFVDPIMVGGLPRSSWQSLRLVTKSMPASVVDIPLTRDVWDLLVLAEQAPNRESLPELPPEACVVWDAIQQAGKTVKEVRPPFILDLLEHFPRRVMDEHQRALEHVLLYGAGHPRQRPDYSGIPLHLRDVPLVRGFMNEPFTFGCGGLRVLSALRPGGSRSRRARVVRARRR